MSHRIELTDDELAALEQLLEQELRTSLVELRHTSNIDYKERVRANIALLQRLTKALHAEPVA
ncbi:MAG: hypothetical protein WCK05_04265 [Planctomycetota bacterium]|jgi:transcription initiation factor IIE alpha subunit